MWFLFWSLACDFTVGRLFRKCEEQCFAIIPCGGSFRSIRQPFEAPGKIIPPRTLARINQGARSRVALIAYRKRTRLISPSVSSPPPRIHPIAIKLPNSSISAHLHTPAQATTVSPTRPCSVTTPGNVHQSRVFVSTFVLSPIQRPLAAFLIVDAPVACAEC